MPIDQAQVDRNLNVWWQAMEATHEMILAGLRRKIGPDEDLGAAYRIWYRQQRDLAARRLEREAERYQLRQVMEPENDTRLGD